MRWLSYIFPQTVLRTSSRYNRDIRVNEERGQYKLLVEGARESGEYIRKLWEYVFFRFKAPQQSPKNILVLGIAGGTVIHIVSDRYPEAEIVGVDIDQIMIDVGKRYFGLDAIANLRIICTDAQKFIKTTRDTFDLIIVDLFIGPNVPDFVLTPDFQETIKRLLTNHGITVINYLRQPGYEEKAVKLDDVLRALYDDVRSVDRYNNRFFYAKIS